MRKEVGVNDTSSKYAMTLSVDLVDIKMLSQSIGTSTQLTNGQSFGRCPKRPHVSHWLVGQFVRL